MWSYGTRLNSNQFRFGYEYKALEPNDGIPADVYESIARAADLLYAETMNFETSLEMQKLQLIDLEVDFDGTAEANEMLKEIFDKKR